MPGTEVQVFEGDGVHREPSLWDRVQDLIAKIEGTRFRANRTTSLIQFEKLVTAVQHALRQPHPLGHDVIVAASDLDGFLQHNADKLYDEAGQQAFKVQTWAHQAWQIAIEADKRWGSG